MTPSIQTQNGQSRAQARAANGEAPLSLAEARQRYQPDGNAITDRFNGRGNCMGHAEKIVAELAKIGVTAHIVGHYTANLIDMNDPRLDRPGRLHQEFLGRKPRPAASRTSTSSFRSRTTRTRSACC